MDDNKNDFESLTFKAFDFERILQNDNQDPDENFFSSLSIKDSKYFTPDEAYTELQNFSSGSFSILHLNIRSLQKNFDKLLSLLETLKFDRNLVMTG